MSEIVNEKEKNKQVVKDIILQLHKGLSVEKAKERFEKEVGDITSTEIAQIEQSLINEGVTVDEIKKFCNVHALLFEKNLKVVVSDKESPNHPVSLFKKENREIEKITARIKKVKESVSGPDEGKFRKEIRELLSALKGIDAHYTRKEQLLFPFLEKYGFFGPSKVMWGKHNDIRVMLKNAVKRSDDADVNKYLTECIDPLVEEVDGMIFKEENILFPASLEKLNTEDWVDIIKQSPEIGYVYIEPPKDLDGILKEIKGIDNVVRIDAGSNAVVFPTGNLNVDELMGVLNALPVDVTFVDREDKVKYFSEGKSRTFVRTKSIIGRNVKNCHPPQSVDKVTAIIDSFREKKRDFAEFWINFKSRIIHIRYFAVRGVNGEYLGTIEVTQDITGIKRIEGERRLLNETN